MNKEERRIAAGEVYDKRMVAIERTYRADLGLIEDPRYAAEDVAWASLRSTLAEIEAEADEADQDAYDRAHDPYQPEPVDPDRAWDERED